MRATPWIAAYVGLTLAGICTPSSGGAEPANSIDAVLAKWERASRNCRSFDARFTRLNYDAWSPQGRSQRGRFYFEAPDKARYEVGPDGAASSNEELYIWSGDKVLSIDLSCKTYVQWPISELEQMRMQLRQRDTVPRDRLSWCARFFASLSDGIALAMFSLSRPEEALPLAVNIDAADLRKRFDFTVEQVDGKPWLTAVPKLQDDRLRYEKIQVILDPHSYRTVATQAVYSPGHCRIMHVFEDVKINERPKDRDLLLKPDLSGFRRVDAPLALH